MANKILEAHKINLQKHKEQGASPRQVMAYIKKHKLTKEMAYTILDGAKGSKYKSRLEDEFVNTKANALRQILGQGTLMGFGDELFGTAKGLYDAVGTDESFGDSINRNIDAERDANEEFQTAFPKTATAYQIGGGLATGGAGAARAAAMRGSALLPRMVQGAKTGFGYGAVGGAGRSEGNILDADGRMSRGLGTVMGAGTGAVTGASMPAITQGISSVVGGIGRTLAPKATARLNAESLVRRAGDEDALTGKDLTVPLSRMPANAIIPDLAGRRENALRDVVRQAAGTTGGKQLASFLGNRQDAQGSRILETIDSTMPTEGLEDFLFNTTEQRKASAAKNYGEAYSQPLEINETLQGFLNNKIIQKLYNDADNLAEYENIELGLSAGRFAEGSNYPPPTLEEFDFIKQALDDRVNELYGKSKGGEASKAKSLRDRLKDELDRQIPAYKLARSEYAGYSAAMEAANLGKDFIEKPRAVSKRVLTDMGDHERKSFQVGVAEALRTKILMSDDGSNFADKIFKKQEIRDRLRLAFDDDATFERFAEAMQNEQRMGDTTRRALGGSVTARMQNDRDTSGGLEEVENLLSANPLAIARRFLTEAGPPPEEVAAELQKIFTPDNNARALQILNSGSPKVRKAGGMSMPILSNSLAGNSPRLLQGR
jgi:hypothetical protein